MEAEYFCWILNRGGIIKWNNIVDSGLNLCDVVELQAYKSLPALLI
jgi:hypothetical protein